MRHIKFRALNDKNEFIFGFYVGNFNPHLKENEICDYFIYRGLRNIEGLLPVNGKTVGQCAGLKDKAGFEIYDDDVLKVSDPYDENETQIVCEFKAGAYSVEWPGMFHEGNDITTISWAMEMGFTFEIIGNIHQNPELLNPKEI